MSDRTWYYREWYQKNRKKKIAQSKAWIKKKKRELGKKGYREWKKKENDKYIEKERLALEQ